MRSGLRTEVWTPHDHHGIRRRGCIRDNWPKIAELSAIELGRWAKMQSALHESGALLADDWPQQNLKLGLFYATNYGVKADGKTVTDATITSGTNTLSSTQAAFSAADIGKVVVVPAAGTAITGTTTAAITNGGAVTAFTVSALANAIPAGPIKITAGANSQWFVTPGAAAGATSIPLIGASVGALSAAGAGLPLSTGAAVTSIPVGPLVNALPSGTIQLVYVDAASVTHTQTFTTTGAAANATSIPVTSATPNYAYPVGTQVFGSPRSVTANAAYASGSTVSTQTSALFGYIGSVSGGVASLVTTHGGSTALNAGTTIASGGEVFYATDDTVGAQACINDAVAANGTAVFPDGDIGLSATLTATNSVDIEGQGIMELYGGTDALNTADFPTIAPYLTGTVFVQCAPNVDCFQLSALGRSQHVRRFGIRFAGKFYQTGHGLNRTASLAQLGVIGGVVEDVRVFGHDGNHYGDVMDSQELCRNVGFRSYGGGGMWLRTNAQTSVPGPPGNLTVLDQYSMTIVGGVAHNFLIDACASNYFDYCVFVNPEHIVSAPSPAISNTGPPTPSQLCIQTYYNGSGTRMLTMGFIDPVCESNLSPASQSVFPAGNACWRTNDPPLSPVGNPAMTTAPVSGTGYQNLTGKPMQSFHMFTLGPPASPPATATTLNGAVSAGATQIVVASATGLAVGQGIQIDVLALSEFAIITAISGTTITLLTAGNWGLSINHATGVAVKNGAAVVIGQVNSSNSWTGQFKPVWLGAAVASAPVTDSFTLLIPSGWWWRLDWSTSSVTRMWSEHIGVVG